MTPEEQADAAQHAANAPLLEPGDRCFHCGAHLLAGAPFCSSCGGARLLSPNEERGAIAYLLRASEDAVRRRVYSAYTAEMFEAPFRKKLGIGPKLLTGSATSPTANTGTPTDFRVFAINAMLYLGAFFVVMASFVFVAVVGNLGRTVLTGLLAVSLMGAGLLARRIPTVRVAGSVLFAAGALVLPFVFVAALNTINGSGALSDSAIIFTASSISFLLYTAFALIGFGRFYGLLSLGAIILGNALPKWQGFEVGIWIEQVGFFCLWAAAVLTLITGWDYLRVGIKHMD